MGLKSDLDFLRNVSMGAVGSAMVMKDLAASGFSPIELERSCTSNKMWKTRFRRQRVPDLLCVRTGIRFEVRGKGALCIRMSDSPNRPERRWDAGLRGRDVVAIVQIKEDGEEMTAAAEANYFKVADLRSSGLRTRDAGRKVPAQGSEASIEWPCTVPAASGRVSEVTDRHIVAMLDDGKRRRYRLDGRQPYVRPGDAFIGDQTIIAGIIARKASPAALLRMTWNAWDALRSRDPLDRLGAAKAVPHLTFRRTNAAALLEQALIREKDVRVALELAGALAQIDAPCGFDYLANTLNSAASEEAMLEAVLILSQLKGARPSNALHALATSARFHGREIRQAAAWGLGKHGCAHYRKLIDFIADDDEMVCLHSICALSGKAESCADEIIARMMAADEHGAASYSAALEQIGTRAVLERLIDAWRSAAGNPWIPLTVARMPEDMVRGALAGHALFAVIEPLLMYRSRSGNWLSRESTMRDFQFLSRQTVFT
jgi:hypothetical protein